MIKNMLKGIGVAFLLIIGIFASLGIWTAYQSATYEKTAVPYIASAIPDISTWDPIIMKSYMAPETLEGVPVADFEQVAIYLRKLGYFISMEQPQFQTITTDTSTQNGPLTLVSYLIPVQYEHGQATLSVVLKEKENSFEVYRFNVDSMALLK
jgi:hypothetical protein